MYRETITIFNNQQISVNALHLETLTWRTDVYKYTTGARPDEPDFKRKGGEIYIIMVHAGTGRAPDVLPFFELTRTVKVPPSIIPVKQYPASDSGTPSGSDLACTRFPYVMHIGTNKMEQIRLIIQTQWLCSRTAATPHFLSTRPTKKITFVIRLNRLALKQPMA